MLTIIGERRLIMDIGLRHACRLKNRSIAYRLSKDLGLNFYWTSCSTIQTIYKVNKNIQCSVNPSVAIVFITTYVAIGEGGK